MTGSCACLYINGDCESSFCWLTFIDLVNPSMNDLRPFHMHVVAQVVMTRLGYSIPDIALLPWLEARKVVLACLRALQHMHTTRPQVFTLTQELCPDRDWDADEEMHWH